MKPALELLSNLVDSPESYHLCKELLNGVQQELLSHQASKKKSSKSNAEYATMPQLARNRIYRRAGIGIIEMKSRKAKRALPFCEGGPKGSIISSKVKGQSTQSTHKKQAYYPI